MIDLVKLSPARVISGMLWYSAYMCICFLGLFGQILPVGGDQWPLFYALLLLDFVLNNETLVDVIEAIRAPLFQLFLTFVLTLILVYFFSILAYVFLRDEFILDGDGDGEYDDAVCNTLWRCILNTFHQGLRAGGGIGDVLKQVEYGDATYSVRVAYDMAFWIVVILIVLNLLLGIIIDKFAELRKVSIMQVSAADKWKG